MERGGATRRRCPRGRPVRSRIASPATCSRSWRRPRSRPTTSRSTRCCAVDQINGPQTLLAQLSQFQPADTPERLDAWLVADPRATGRTSTPTSTSWPTACASGRTAARIVAERTIDQIKRMQAIADRGGDRPVDVEGGLGGRPGARAGRRAPTSRIRRTAGSSTRSRARTTPRRASSRGSCRSPDGDTLYRHAIRRWTSLDMEPTDVHQVGLDELASIDDERRAIAGAEGFGDGPRRLPREARHGPGEPGPDPGGARRALQRGHRAGGRGRADDVRAAAGGELRGPPGRGVQGARRAVRVLLPAVARPARGPASTT